MSARLPPLEAEGLAGGGDVPTVVGLPPDAPPPPPGWLPLGPGAGPPGWAVAVPPGPAGPVDLVVSDPELGGPGGALAWASKTSTGVRRLRAR